MHGLVTRQQQLKWDCKGEGGRPQVKINRALFPKHFIIDALVGMPGGVHIVLKGTHHEIPLVALGYRYSTKSTFFFVHRMQV